MLRVTLWIEGTFCCGAQITSRSLLDVLQYRGWEGKNRSKIYWNKISYQWLWCLKYEFWDEKRNLYSYSGVEFVNGHILQLIMKSVKKFWWTSWPMIIFNFEMWSMYITLWCHRSTRIVMSVSVFFVYATYVLFYDITFSTSMPRFWTVYPVE